tara:strand:+ start:127 stop:786 length:660 start_codon:yes stop_codon:yes gene_type:complete
MLITLLEFECEYCILDYSLEKENLELLGVKHWLNILYSEYNIKKFKTIFGSDYFSKHIKFVEINKIPDINLKSQNIIINDIDICGINEDGYIIEPKGNNSFFRLSIRGELIFEVPQTVLLEWADIKNNQKTASNEEFKFNRDKFYSWHRKEKKHKDGSVSYTAGDDIWRMLDYWLAIKTDDPKIDCFSAWDGGIDDFKYKISEENIEDTIASLNSKNLD